MPPAAGAAARTPRPAGLPLPTRAAGRRAGSARFARSTNVARGSAQAPPSFQTAARAAAGRAPAVAKPGSLCKAAAGCAGGCASLAKPVGLCRSLCRCSVAPGPRMRVGRGLPSACAAPSGHVAPVWAACVAHPRPSLASTRPAEPGRGLRRGAALRFPRSSPPCPPCAAACASATPRKGGCLPRGQANRLTRKARRIAGLCPCTPCNPGDHRPPAPQTKTPSACQRRGRSEGPAGVLSLS